VAWLARLDRVGLAQLIEKCYPELAEGLVTLVQPQTDAMPSRFLPLLQAETEQKVAEVNPNKACPLSIERKAWTRTPKGAFVQDCPRRADAFSSTAS
jgi:hypothetical protein